MELEKHITDEKTGISYTLCEDYLPPRPFTFRRKLL
mgnify:CR=1 FL=1